MTLSKQVAIDAYVGVALRNNPGLEFNGQGFTSKHQSAIDEVINNYSDFCDLVRSELTRFPLIRKYFGHLITSRLQQNVILKSDFILHLFDANSSLENRLTRLEGNVLNLSTITANVNAPSDQQLGEETDEVLSDLWNEIFVMDFLSYGHGLTFGNLEKVIRGNSEPQIDLLANQNSYSYAIEITRIRKRDFSGITFPNMFDAIYKPENITTLRRVLKNKLQDKNNQMEKFCANELVAGRSYNKRLVVLKTSQAAYQDGHSVVSTEIEALLSQGIYTSINEVLLIYDIENFDWLK